MAKLMNESVFQDVKSDFIIDGGERHEAFAESS